MEAESDTGFLPDHLINPGEYEPVLPTTEEHTAAELTVDKNQVHAWRTEKTDASVYLRLH